MNQITAIFALHKRKLSWMAVYMVVWCGLIPFFRYEMNPDGISYFSIAQKYAQFDFYHAVNAYWGPLISWLLVPFLWLQLPVLTAARILQLALGALIILLAESFIRKHTERKLLYSSAMISATSLTLWFSLLYFSTDLLFLLLSLLLLYFTEKGRIYKKTSWLYIGLTGAALYFCKAYGLPFFIAAFILLLLREFIFEEKMRKQLIGTGVRALAVFVAVSGIWIGILSVNYGFFTTGSAGGYNQSLVGPEMRHHATDYMGLISPPNETALSAWEDISLVEVPRWSPFDSRESMVYQMNLISHNFLVIWRNFKHFTFLSTIILFLGLLYFIQKGRSIWRDNLSLYFIVSLALVSGYSIIICETRYLWLISYLLLFSSVALLDYLAARIKPDRIVSLLTVLLLTAGFVKTPVLDLKKYFQSDKEVHALFAEYDSFHVEGRIASVGDWRESLDLVFLSGRGQYYGNLKCVPVAEAHSQTDVFDIDYILVWETGSEEYVPDDFRDISGLIGGQLRIFKRF